ncbi:putative aarF domain-containing protein kinase 2 isoform X4 [Sminthopsis crassicaudata]|uniref:putative aarF domain-containing protein kinase 2 isoform X4 n=1 Tax=Sminthopsis crassicaudata TaxID=9301 RepID=UPI003D69A210
MASWRLPVAAYLGHRGCFEVGRRACLLRWSPRQVLCPPKSGIGWLLLGAIPKLILTSGGSGMVSPGHLGACLSASEEVRLAGDISQTGNRVWLNLAFGLRTGFRACVLLVKFTPLLLLYPFTYLVPSFYRLWLRGLLLAIESSGPTYIKLGQWASTRRDLFSEEFCTQFSRLHVQAFPDLLLPMAYLTASRLATPLPPPADCTRPKHLIPAAIKVLHPGLLAQVQVDLVLMKLGSRILGLIPGVKWLSLTEIVEEFEKLMVQQIDLRYEARNLECFQHNFMDVNFVRFPTPLQPFVTRDVLVETFEESVPVSWYQKSEIPTKLKGKIAKLGIDMLLKMVFVDNFVHADLHPGNILVQGADFPKESLGDVLGTPVLESRPASSPLKLVLLDAGIVAGLQAADLENFRAVFTAVAMGQGERVAELILQHARASECRDVKKFKAEMAVLVSQARKNTITLEKLQVANLLSSVFKLLMTHKVKLESNFASIVFAIMVLEGLGRSLDPKMDILEAAKPYLIKSSTFPPWLQW